MRQFLLTIVLALTCCPLVAQEKTDRGTPEVKTGVTTIRIESRQLAVVTYRQSGVMVYTVIYDGNNRELESADYQPGGAPDTKRAWKYDERGNEIEFLSYIHGSLTHRTLYKYDNMNRRIEEVDFDANGQQKSKYLSQYQKRNRMIRLEVQANGLTIRRSVSTLNDLGKVLTRTEYDRRGAIEHRYVFTYDGRGNKTSETDYYKSNGHNKSSKHTYAFNDPGHLIEETLYFDFVLHSKTTYKRDTRGNPTEVVETDGSGRMTEKQVWTYEFDSEKNWVKAVVSEWTDKAPNVALQPTSEIRRIFGKANVATYALWSAAEEGELALVKNLLENGADANVSHPDGGTALIKATAKGHLDVVGDLLKAKVQVDARDADGWTALMWAAEFGHIEVVKLLLANGADPRAKNNLSGVAIMPAALNGHIDIVKLLLEKGADVNAVANDGSSALMVAAGEGRVESVRFLLANGADKSAKTTDGATALFFAASSDNPDVVRVLIESGLDVNERAKGGLTPLMSATYRFQTEIVKLLIDHGADVNARTDDGKTALSMAMQFNNSETAELLRKAGAK